MPVDAAHGPDFTIVLHVLHGETVALRPMPDGRLAIATYCWKTVKTLRYVCRDLDDSSTVICLY